MELLILIAVLFAGWFIWWKTKHGQVPVESESSDAPPAPSLMKWVKIGLAIIIILAFWRACSSTPTSTTPSAPTQSDLAFGVGLDAEKQLKSNLRDPDSLVITSAFVPNDSQTTCMKYRAKNAFGGYINEEAIIIGNGMIGSKSEQFIQLWKEVCAGQKGYDVARYLN